MDYERLNRKVRRLEVMVWLLVAAVPVSVVASLALSMGWVSFLDHSSYAETYVKKINTEHIAITNFDGSGGSLSLMATEHGPSIWITGSDDDGLKIITYNHKGKHVSKGPDPGWRSYPIYLFD